MKPLQENIDLIRAVGGAISLLSAMMERKGIASIEEISEFFGVYAVVASETSAEEGMILGCWDAMLRDLIQKRNGEDS